MSNNKVSHVEAMDSCFDLTTSSEYPTIGPLMFNGIFVVAAIFILVFYAMLVIIFGGNEQFSTYLGGTKQMIVFGLKYLLPLAIVTVLMPTNIAILKKILNKRTEDTFSSLRSDLKKQNKLRNFYD